MPKGRGCQAVTHANRLLDQVCQIAFQFDLELVLSRVRFLLCLLEPGAVERGRAALVALLFVPRFCLRIGLFALLDRVDRGAVLVVRIFVEARVKRGVFDGVECEGQGVSSERRR